MIKNPPSPIFFFIKRGYFDQKLPGESDKNGPDALQQQFLTWIGSFCWKKILNEEEAAIFYPHFQY